MHGTVQGVFFRARASDEARRLGINGRVWNRGDGAVECVAEGDAAQLEKLREWLGHGPPRADVESVEVTDLVGEPEYTDFRAR